MNFTSKPVLWEDLIDVNKKNAGEISFDTASAASNLTFAVVFSATPLAPARNGFCDRSVILHLCVHQRGFVQHIFPSDFPVASDNGDGNRKIQANIQAR